MPRREDNGGACNRAAVDKAPGTSDGLMVRIHRRDSPGDGQRRRPESAYRTVAERGEAARGGQSSTRRHVARDRGGVAPPSA